MFKIVENRFLKDGIVKYEDEDKNRLMVIGDRQGKELKVKLRPANGAKFETVHLNLPYDDEGLMFHISKESSVELDEADYIDMAKATVKVVQQWVEIAIGLSYLTSREINLEQELVEDLIEKLEAHEEVRDFVTLYKTLLFSDVEQKQLIAEVAHMTQNLA